MPYQESTDCPSVRKLPTPRAGGGSPATLTLPRVKPGDPAGLAIVTALESALLRIRATEEVASQGDHEGIHRLRTATRRLRSDLRALRDLVDPDWVEVLETELKWFTGLLGEVRDVDVLTRRLELALSRRDTAEIEAMAPLFERLAARREQGLRDVRDAFEGDRYHNLLASLQLAVERPALKDEAYLPCRKTLPPLARASWRRLKKSARELSPSDPDESFHEIRKRAKRARYNAEMIVPILGRPTARRAHHYIRGVTRIQDILGEHQDAVIAAREVAEALVLHPDDTAFVTAGRRLLEVQNTAAHGARDAFFHAWRELDHKKFRRWVKHSSKVRSR